MGNEIDLRKFLNTCIAIEKSIGTIYRHFAATIVCDDELKAIWLKMADEEDQHALDIGFAARLPHDGFFTTKKMTQSRVDLMLDSTKKILEKAKKTDVSARVAVNITLKLEQEYLGIHIASALEFENDATRQMFQSMAQGEEEHCRAIKDYYAKGAF